MSQLQSFSLSKCERALDMSVCVACAARIDKGFIVFGMNIGDFRG